MTTLEIEIALMRHYKFMQNLIVPNVTPASGLVGFEADMLMLSKSGYATCFEIKVSRSDLINDQKKSHIKKLDEFVNRYIQRTGFDWYYETLKHFVYVVPESLKDVALETIPSFAGLVAAKKYPESYFPDKVFLNTIKAPKVLHRRKWTDEERYSLARLGVMRVYALKCKIKSMIDAR